MLDIKTCWITVNRGCNLRCAWCYSGSSGFSDKLNIDIEMAKRAVDICKELNVHHITVIGGEPTLYKELPELISYIRSTGQAVSLVTNGLKLADKAYLNTLVDAGVSTYSVSVKGVTPQEYKSVAGLDGYGTLLKAIDNLNASGCRTALSYVLTADNIPTVADGLREIFTHDVRKISLSFCYEFNASGYEDKEYKENNDPCKLVSLFMENYDKINDATGGRFVLAQSIPACMWDRDFLFMLKQRKQLGAVCVLMRGNGLVFDTDMSILPCNVMYGMKIGKYGKDFTTASELNEYLSSPRLEKIYSRLRGVPSLKCADCDIFNMCGGGCAVQYTNYSFDELMSLREKNRDILVWKNGSKN